MPTADISSSEVWNRSVINPPVIRSKSEIGLDLTGAVAQGAKVTAINASTNITSTTVTSSARVYSLPNLQTGPYTFTIFSPGYSEQIANDIDLRVGAEQELNLKIATQARDEMKALTPSANALFEH